MLILMFSLPLLRSALGVVERLLLLGFLARMLLINQRQEQPHQREAQAPELLTQV